MPTITFIDQDGNQREIEAEAGSTVMETAINSDVPGILATCGGSCSCATCHVYVDDAFAGLLPPPDEMESALLDAVAAERQPNSRLSCQLSVTAAFDGLRVRIPETQA